MCFLFFFVVVVACLLKGQLGCCLLSTGLAITLSVCGIRKRRWQAGLVSVPLAPALPKSSWGWDAAPGPPRSCRGLPLKKRKAREVNFTSDIPYNRERSTGCHPRGANLAQTWGVRLLIPKNHSQGLGFALAGTTCLSAPRSNSGCLASGLTKEQGPGFLPGGGGMW